MQRLEYLYRSELPSRAITVYLYLADRAGQQESCFPSVPTIARHTGLSERTVQRAILDLKKGGFLRVRGRQRRNGADSSNLYTLTNVETGWRHFQKPLTRDYSRHSLSPGGCHGDGGM